MNSQRLSSLVLALAVLGVAACDAPNGGGLVAPQSAVTPQPVPRAYGYSNGNIYWATFLGGYYGDQTEVRSAVIGRWGGRIDIGWSSLYVPPMAVWDDTRFTFTLQHSPYLSADLKAARVWGGMPITTFQQPLTLRLSYARSSTPIEDVTALSIFWVQNGVLMERLPTTIDFRAQIVSAQLSHFSEYSPGLDAMD